MSKSSPPPQNSTTNWKARTSSKESTRLMTLGWLTNLRRISNFLFPHGLDHFTPPTIWNCHDRGLLIPGAKISAFQRLFVKEKRVQNQKNWLVFNFSSCSILFSLWKATSGPSSSPVPRSKTLTWTYVKNGQTNVRPTGGFHPATASNLIHLGFHGQSRFTWPESISRMNVWFCLNVFLVLHYGTLWISFSRAWVVEHLLALLQRSIEYTLYCQAARYVE